jgi:hypothetical protein
MKLWFEPGLGQPGLCSYFLDNVVSLMLLYPAESGDLVNPKLLCGSWSRRSVGREGAF